MQHFVFSLFYFRFIFLIIIVLLRYFLFVYAHLRSTLTSFDPEIERTTCVIRRVVKDANIAQGILVEDQLLVSSDSEEEIIMVAIPPQTKGDYCKRTDEGHVSRGFVLAGPANFDVNNYVLSGLRDNPFDENAIRDPWDHLTCFYKTSSM